MKLPAEQLKNWPGKVLWLASYPKSGNTWFRSFLSALFTGDIDINQMNTNGIFSGRDRIEKVLDIDSRLLSEKELKLRLPEVVRFSSGRSKTLQIIKAHDAYVLNDHGEPIFPSEVTHKAIYIVRNPLDIVASLANHNHTSKDKAIKIMNRKKGYLARQKNGLNINNQTPQLMLDWSGHVTSWLDQENIDVLLVRYEELKQDPESTFSNVLKKAGFDISGEDVRAAIELTSFQNLKKIERDQGFREKSAKSPAFFRKGEVGGWKAELSPAQVQSIIRHHGLTMERLGYTGNGH